jgi:hypothetical protein
MVIMYHDSDLACVVVCNHAAKRNANVVMGFVLGLRSYMPNWNYHGRNCETVVAWLIMLFAKRSRMVATDYASSTIGESEKETTVSRFESVAFQLKHFANRIFRCENAMDHRAAKEKL